MPAGFSQGITCIRIDAEQRPHDIKHYDAKIALLVPIMQTRKNGRLNKSLDHGHSLLEIRDRISSSRKPNLLRDTVYGAIDGTVTTFAIISGVAGAGLPSTVIIALGLANVLADGFSMAASNYLGTRSEAENHRRITEMENMHIQDFPVGETPRSAKYSGNTD